MKKLVFVFLLMFVSVVEANTRKDFAKKVYPVLHQLSADSYGIALVNFSDQDLVCAVMNAATQEIKALRVGRRDFSRKYVEISPLSAKFIFKCKEEIII